MVQSSGFRVQGSTFRVPGSGFRVLLELELALKKAEYDLALIRKQIGK